MFLKKCNFPSASPTTKSSIPSPSKSPNVGQRFRAGIFNVVFKFMVDIPSQSLSISSYSGIWYVPVFSKRAKEEVGSLLAL